MYVHNLNTLLPCLQLRAPAAVCVRAEVIEGLQKLLAFFVVGVAVPDHYLVQSILNVALFRSCGSDRQLQHPVPAQVLEEMYLLPSCPSPTAHGCTLRGRAATQTSAFLSSFLPNRCCLLICLPSHLLAGHPQLLVFRQVQVITHPINHRINTSLIMGGYCCLLTQSIY